MFAAADHLLFPELHGRKHRLLPLGLGLGWRSASAPAKMRTRNCCGAVCSGPALLDATSYVNEDCRTSSTCNTLWRQATVDGQAGACGVCEPVVVTPSGFAATVGR